MTDENQVTEQQTTEETSTAPTEDIAKLMDALKKERELRSQYEKEAKQRAKQLEVFNGIDPEKARQAEQVLQQMEELAQRESKLKSEIASQYEPQIQELQKNVQDREQRLLNLQRDIALEKAFYSAGGFEGEFEAIAHGLQSRVQVDNSGNLKVLDDKGNAMFVDGKAATVADLIKELKSKQLWFARHFKDATKPGFGISGSGNGVATDMSGLSDWQQVALLRQQRGKA